MCIRITRCKLEAIIHEHHGTRARRLHSLGKSKGRTFENERAPGRAVAIACNPQTRTVTADSDEWNRFVYDPGIWAPQGLASPRVTAGRVICVAPCPKT